MTGHIARAKSQDGYELERTIEAALPMPVWAVDFEVERERAITAAEQAVLRLVEYGVGDLHRLTRLLGLGSDVRLVETVLVKLLGAGAVEPKEDTFIITQVGEAWKANGNVLQRERVTVDVRQDPTHQGFEWMGEERPAYTTDSTWTIELPPVEDAELLRRKPELGKLIREEGLPDEDDRAPAERRPSTDLLALSVITRRTHWRPVQVGVWAHRGRRDVSLVGSVAEAEHPGLTQLLSGHVLDSRRKRIVPRTS